MDIEELVNVATNLLRVSLEMSSCRRLIWTFHRIGKGFDVGPPKVRNVLEDPIPMRDLYEVLEQSRVDRQPEP